MRSIPLKYGLVVGIFSSVVVLLLCWLAPTIAAGLLPYAIVFGISFGLMLIYNITKKKEMKDSENIPYHEAFINSFIIGFVGIGICFLTFLIARGYLFPEIPEIERKTTIEYLDKSIEIYKGKIKEDGSAAVDMLAELNRQKSNLKDYQFNPMHPDNRVNSLIFVFVRAGILSTFISIIVSFFGYRSRGIIATEETESNA